MRLFAVLALLVPVPAIADQILASSKITAVTVYPQGAQITREVDFNAPAGQHELLITDLPAETQADLIRLTATNVTLGAFSLRTDRLPPRDASNDPDLLAAKAAVDAAQTGVQTAQFAIAAINARVEAAEAQAGFLRGVKPEGTAVTVDGVKALSALIGAEVLAARQAALAAQADLPAAQKAVEAAIEALTNAQAAEAALSQGDFDYTGLSVAIGVPAAGEAHLTMTHFISSASWLPIYDIMLTRAEPSLTIARGVLVSQYSGEDWAGVALTLSTAQPSAQAEPSKLWPELRRLGDAVADDPAFAKDAAGVMETMAEPAVMAAPVTALAGLQGDVVVYRYPTPVDVATGVENLRLALDEIKLTPKIEARAVPRFDQTAFVLASFVNESKEILLPGQAFLLREGTLVGSTYVDVVAPGDKAEVAFGAIDGLRLTRNMPRRAEGDRGFISTSTQIEEQAVLKVENLTDEAWPVKLMDLVPYSEQEDLEISFTADPAPTQTDVDGLPGVMAWEFDLPAGASKEISLQHVIAWPQGKILQ